MRAQKDEYINVMAVRNHLAAGTRATTSEMRVIKAGYSSMQNASRLQAYSSAKIRPAAAFLMGRIILTNKNKSELGVHFRAQLVKHNNNVPRVADVVLRSQKGPEFVRFDV